MFHLMPSQQRRLKVATQEKSSKKKILFIMYVVVETLISQIPIGILYHLKGTQLQIFDKP